MVVQARLATSFDQFPRCAETDTVLAEVVSCAGSACLDSLYMVPSARAGRPHHPGHNMRLWFRR